MELKQIKFDIHRHFRIEHGVTLTQEQLDDIHDFYHDARKESIKDVIYYRFINMMLSVILLLVFFVWVYAGEETIRNNWFTLVVLSVFFFYNQIHGIFEWIRYKRIKTPKRPSDE